MLIRACLNRGEGKYNEHVPVIEKQMFTVIIKICKTEHLNPSVLNFNTFIGVFKCLQGGLYARRQSEPWSPKRRLVCHNHRIRIGAVWGVQLTPKSHH